MLWRPSMSALVFGISNTPLPSNLGVVNTHTTTPSRKQIAVVMAICFLRRRKIRRRSAIVSSLRRIALSGR